MRPAAPPEHDFGRRRRQALLVTAAWLAGVALPAGAQRAGFPELKGRWQRPDGGYVLEFREIDANGRIEASYFNPRPINVSKATATREGLVVKVFVELNAPNYPGSTYTLTYDAKQDELQGTYFQAVQRQDFAVTFVRMK